MFCPNRVIETSPLEGFTHLRCFLLQIVAIELYRHISQSFPLYFHHLLMFRSRVSWPIALMFWFSCVVAAVHGFMCTTLSSIDSFTLFSFFLNPILTRSRWRRLWPLPSLPSGFYLLRVWLHRWLSGDEEEKLVSACSVLVNNEQACQIGFMLTTGETPAPRHTGTRREGGGRESHKNPSVQRHTTQRSHIQPYISFVLRINVFF